MGLPTAEEAKTTALAERFRRVAQFLEEQLIPEYEVTRAVDAQSLIRLKEMRNNLKNGCAATDIFGRLR